MNLHIYPSIITFESRLEKIAVTLIDEQVFHSIVILGIWEPGLPRRERFREGIEIVRVKNYGAFLPYFLRKILDLLSLFFYAIFRTKNVQVINCHSLNCLFIGIFHRLLKGTKLIYDTHELETERNGLKGFRQRFSKLLEQLAIPFCDHIFVVGDKIKHWYTQRYSLDKNRITTIYNFPKLTDQMEANQINLKSELNIAPQEILFVYVGLMVQGRGLLELIKAFEFSKHHLVFIGYGPQQKELELAARKYSNIQLYPAVRPQELLSVIRSADVGIFTPFTIHSLSYQYCMPNKIFEYIQAKLPVVVSSLDEVKLHIQKNDIGWIVPSANDLSDLIQQISAEQIEQKKTNIGAIQQYYSWEHQTSKLVTPYISIRC